jgi:hypothetical protein
MILIISDRHDVHTLKVESFLINESVEYIRFNIDVESLKSTLISYDENDWVINCPNGSFKTSEIKVIWNRRTYVELLLDEIDNNDASFKIWKGEWNKTLLGMYSSLESKKWLNFYRDAYYAENKYRQYISANRIGLRTPSFVCSNDKQFLKKSFGNGNDKVLKFMNQDFYKMEEGVYKGIYVNKIKSNDLETFQNEGENPIILQNYISKNFEVRYTVVGKEHFVCKIDSQLSKIANVDWRRYDLANTPHSIITPPVNIRNKINEFMLEFNLNYGAIDFIVDKNNEWFFLELNSMGQYLWIEDLTGLEISRHIAKWLIINN